ncbi:ectoine/hydroxyectoine ABC transporter permease subunit EhuD [soil metagenome]
MVFDVDYALEILPRLLAASVVTIQATFAAMAVALVVGLIIAILRMSPIRPLSMGVGLVTEAIRSTPVLIQLFIAFYIIVPRLGLPPTPLLAGILALGIHYATYCSEVYRAGIQAVPRGQWEAARALNMTALTTWRRVVIPQAIPPVIPALGNYLIALFKETPVLFVITVVELFGQALQIMGETYRPFEPILMVGLIFLLLSYPSSLAVRRLEKRLAHA